MTAEQEAEVRGMAARVLAEPNASIDRLAWANDVLAWLDMGDWQAAKRCGYEPPAPARICEGKAA